MKLPNNFPKELKGGKLVFVTRPKCFSGIYDMESRQMLTIEYYALTESDKNSGVSLLSMDDSFKIIDKSHFFTVEEAMYELEPDNISEKDWKELIQWARKHLLETGE